MAESKHAEIVVIGAGPGGYAAAFRAADLGKQVILIDKDPTLGGVCLNRGCIPSKALLHISKVMEEASHLSKMGITYGEPQIDLDAIRAHKDKIVFQLNEGIAQMAKARKVEWVKGAATFTSNTELSVKTDVGDIAVSFNKCIVAAGSVSATIPGVPADHPSVLTSRTALDLVDIPKRLLVIGGGIIGLELGQVYAALGSKVSVVEFLPNLLPGTDSDLVKPLQRKLKKQFESIQLSSKVTTVTPNKKGTLYVTIENEKGTKKEVFNKVLVSVGRKPNTNLLNIEATGVEVNEHGFINVDVYQRTSEKNIFAIGDIVGNPMLAHKATHEGKVAAEVASGHPAGGSHRRQRNRRHGPSDVFPGKSLGERIQIGGRNYPGPGEGRRRHVELPDHPRIPQNLQSGTATGSGRVSVRDLGGGWDHFDHRERRSAQSRRRTRLVPC